MRFYHLIRDEDVTGLSGTGTVAEVVEFWDGTVAMRWTTEPDRSTVLWDGIDQVERIHGHNGRTRLKLRYEMMRRDYGP